MMNVEYQLTADDIKRASQHVYIAGFARRLPIFVAALAGGLLVAIGVMAAVRGDAGAIFQTVQRAWVELSILLALVVVLIPLANYLIAIPRASRRQYRQARILQIRRQMQTEEGGLRFLDETGNHLVPWDHIRKRRETTDQFILHLSDAHLLIVPKRALGSDDIATFRALLAAKMLAE